MDDIEPIEIKFDAWGTNFTAYRTPETRKYDKQFDPKDLYRRVKKRMLCEWPFTGETLSEKAIKDILFLESRVGYFVAIPEDVFEERATKRGFNDSITTNKIEIVQVRYFSEIITHQSGETLNISRLVMISGEALKKAQEFKI